MSLTFRDLLAPLTPEEFLTDWWAGKPRLTRVDADRLRELVDQAAFLRAVGAPGASAAGVRLHAGGHDARGDHVELAITAEQIRPLLALGHTIHAFHLQAVHEPARALIADATRTLGVVATMDVGVFLSGDASGFGFHYDATATWTMQLEGEKLWWHGKAPIAPFPRRNHAATATERAAMDADEVVERRLQPGDVLYLPPGTWHRARAVGHSLHASINIRPSSVLDLVRDALAPLLDDARWRRIPLGAESGVAAELAERMADLRAHVAALAPDALVDAWRRRSVSSDDTAPIRPDEVLARIADIEVTETVGADDDARLALHLAGQRVASLPGDARQFVAALAAARRFRAGDAGAWDIDFGWEEVEGVLRALVELGFLERDL
jgi:ribosomal protein L16 Arg81 hydroxylase